MEKIFLDMDGVLADFNSVFSEDRRHEMYEEGFFYNLKPLFDKKDLEKVFQELKEIGLEINILSIAVDSPYCKKEKYRWIEENMPKLDNIFILNSGEDKSIIQENIEGCILFDDFTRNIEKWVSRGGVGVKVGGSKKKEYLHLESITKLLELF